MSVPIVLLLTGCLLEGVLPGVHASAEHAAAFFVQPGGYRKVALDHLTVLVDAPRPGNWSGRGIALGFASTVIAVVIGAAGCYSVLLAKWMGRLTELGARAFEPLRRAHSGHIGDYIAWMMADIAILAALVSLPLLRR